MFLVGLAASASACDEPVVVAFASPDVLHWRMFLAPRQRIVITHVRLGVLVWPNTAARPRVLRPSAASSIEHQLHDTPPPAPSTLVAQETIPGEDGLCVQTQASMQTAESTDTSTPIDLPNSESPTRLPRPERIHYRGTISRIVEASLGVLELDGTTLLFAANYVDGDYWRGWRPGAVLTVWNASLYRCVLHAVPPCSLLTVASP
jgi:hypothetical protein